MNSETSQFPKPDLKKVSALVNSETRERFPVGPERVTIGRKPDNTLCLEQDVYVSGHHAHVYFEKGECWLRDLGSSNGSLVNNVTVSSPVKIKPGDMLTIGRTKLEVE